MADWKHWKETPLAHLSWSAIFTWRKRGILKKNKHWKLRKIELTKGKRKCLLINAELVTEEFIREHYRPQKPTKYLSSNLTEREVRELREKYKQAGLICMPEYLHKACKEFGIPIEIDQQRR